MHYRRLTALLMVCAFLFLPLESFANHEPAFSPTLYSTSPLEIASPEEPDSHCPCTDRHGSDGCSFNCSCCSCCSFFAPLPTGISCRSIPPVTSFSMIEPFKRFPEVYLPIFVPPQNRS